MPHRFPILLAALSLSACGPMPRPELPASVLPSAALSIEAIAMGVADGIVEQLAVSPGTPAQAAKRLRRLKRAQTALIAGRVAYDARLGWRGEPIPLDLADARDRTDAQLAALFSRLEDLR